MNIHQALRYLPFKKQIYIKWKFNLWFDQEKMLTEEQVLKQLDVKSFNAYHRFEKSDEYKAFVSIYLASKSAQDMLDIYETVKSKATNGDMKAIEMMLKLQKEIDLKKKAAEQFFQAVEDDQGDDGLEVQYQYPETFIQKAK